MHISIIYHFKFFLLKNDKRKRKRISYLSKVYLIKYLNQSITAQKKKKKIKIHKKKEKKEKKEKKRDNNHFFFYFSFLGWIIWFEWERQGVNVITNL